MAAKNEQHHFANDGSDWTTPPSPVDPEEKVKADEKVRAHAEKTGDGPSAKNGR